MLRVHMSANYLAWKLDSTILMDRDDGCQFRIEILRTNIPGEGSAPLPEWRGEIYLLTDNLWLRVHATKPQCSLQKAQALAIDWATLFKG